MASRIPFDRSSSAGGGQLGNEERQEDGELLPLGVGVGQDDCQEPVGAEERLRPALEFHLAILVQLLSIGRHAGVQDGVELVTVGSRKVQRHQLVHLGRAVDLIPVQRRLEVVQPVGVGFVRQDGRLVVVGEGVLDGVGVVGEVQHEGVVLLGMRPVETR